MSMLVDRNVDRLMVEKKDEKDVPILKEDQMRINKFARLSSRAQGFQEESKKKLQELENIRDALAAVEEFAITAEEDDKLRLSVGECFVEVRQEVAEERLNDMIKTAQEDIQAIEQDMKDTAKEMDDLKVILYAKFGKTINLELDPEDD